MFSCKMIKLIISSKMTNKPKKFVPWCLSGFCFPSEEACWGPSSPSHGKIMLAACRDLLSPPVILVRRRLPVNIVHWSKENPLLLRAGPSQGWELKGCQACSSGRLLPTLRSLPKANPQQCQPPPAQDSHPKPWYLQHSVILK